MTAIICGVLLGHLDPENGQKMKFVGYAFVQLVKVFIGPIIFLTIALGIAGMGD